ncbi:MAG: phosphoribosyltransferase [Nitrososphaeria archaeon]|jgi:predicted phosphoribosyltransferase
MNGIVKLPFQDREEAGKMLALKLTEYSNKDTIVLAIPRGGVVIGYQIARKLKAPLDIIVPRKIGAPDNSELAIGAVAEDGSLSLDESAVMYMNISKSYIEEESRRQITEIRRRLKLYRGETPYPMLQDHVIIIVDDGIATGSTIKAAIASIRKKKPKSVVVAVPVAPRSTVKELEKEADRVICLSTPEFFYAIGQFYVDFSQTTDGEVIRLLKKSREETETYV